MADIENESDQKPIIEVGPDTVSLLFARIAPYTLAASASLA